MCPFSGQRQRGPLDGRVWTVATSPGKGRKACWQRRTGHIAMVRAAMAGNRAETAELAPTGVDQFMSHLIQAAYIVASLET